MNRLLLVDCDGTIREPLSGSKFIQHPRDQRIIKGADKAIAHYAEQGWCAVGISNQAGVAAGHKQLADALAEAERTLELFPQITAIYLCPDFEGKHCWLVGREHDAKPIHLAPWAEEFVGSFRKPQPGMLWAALKNHCGMDCLECLYVGDHDEDEKAAERALIKFVWADVWRGRSW
jgi:D-glycero-D-manno-heptose 1,7-bisphosphate phosphatase